MRKRKQPRDIISRAFRCEECGGKNYAVKYRGHTQVGHIKDFYCVWCGKETKQIQIG